MGRGGDGGRVVCDKISISAASQLSPDTRIVSCSAGRGSDRTTPVYDVIGMSLNSIITARKTLPDLLIRGCAFDDGQGHVKIIKLPCTVPSVDAICSYW